MVAVDRSVERSEEGGVSSRTRLLVKASMIGSVRDSSQTSGATFGDGGEGGRG